MSEPRDEFEERLRNWGRTVRDPRYQRGVCATWARLYLAKRGDVPDEEDDFPKVHIPRNDLDGWAMEKAWRTMPNSVHKWVLKYHYVLRLSWGDIRSRMYVKHSVNFRGREQKALLQDAVASLRKAI